MTLERRKIGHSGVEVPVVGLGTWGLCDESYGPVAEPQAARTIARALDVGVTLFDMAPTWGPDGRSERMVAQAVGSRRDEVVYATRTGARRGEHGLEHDMSPEGLRASCEQSLRRLATDRVDILLLHNPTPEALSDDDVRSTLEALVREGKARCWGASVAEIHAARSAVTSGADVLCLPHNLLRPELLWSLENDLLSRQIGVLASSVLSHGLLAGRWGSHNGFASNDHRARRWSREALTARVTDVQKLRRLVQGDVLSLASAALRFAVSEPSVSCALVGARTSGQIESAARSVGEPPYLPETARAELRKQAGF